MAINTGEQAAIYARDERVREHLYRAIRERLERRRDWLIRQRLLPHVEADETLRRHYATAYDEIRFALKAMQYTKSAITRSAQHRLRKGRL